MWTLNLFGWGIALCSKYKSSGVAASTTTTTSVHFSFLSLQGFKITSLSPYIHHMNGEGKGPHNEVLYRKATRWRYPNILNVPAKCGPSVKMDQILFFDQDPAWLIHGKYIDFEREEGEWMIITICMMSRIISSFSMEMIIISNERGGKTSINFQKKIKRIFDLN